MIAAELVALVVGYGLLSVASILQRDGRRLAAMEAILHRLGVAW